MTETAPPPGARHAALPEGTLLGGRYRIEALLGSGGMGHVYRAHDVDLDRPVALKTLQVFSEDALVRFKREVKLATRVTHPNVIRLYDLVSDAQASFVTMELIEGVSLRARLGAGPLPVGEAAEIARQCALGLHAAHRADVVHRDFKPENVLIERGGRVVVCDFGVAGEQADGVMVASAIVGTSAYMAPEQANGHAPTARADLYALGLVLAEMLTGAVPLTGQGPVATALRREREPPPSLRAARAEVPELLDGLAQRLLALAPALRPDSADAVADLLAPLATPLGPVDSAPAEASATRALRPARAQKKPKSRRFLYLAAGATLAATAATGYLLTRDHGSSPAVTADAGAGADAAPAPAAAPAAAPDPATACLAGDPAACLAPGLAYLQGNATTPKDPVRGVDLLDRGCRGGAAEACAALGVAYQDGVGTARDPARAAVLFDSACQQSSMRGCMGLAGLLANGNGVAKDEARAVAIYERACQADQPAACGALGVHLVHGLGVAVDRPRAARLFQSGCDRDNGLSCFRLGLLYHDGAGVPKDVSRAVLLVEKGCQLRVGPACDWAGRMYVFGDGVSKSEAHAVELFQQACDLGDAGGCANLGIATYDGVGVARDLGRALAANTYACEHGAFQACSRLGGQYFAGEGVKQDQARALAIFERGCDGGDAASCAGLAAAYRNGSWVDKDPARADALDARACKLDRKACK